MTSKSARHRIVVIVAALQIVLGIVSIALTVVAGRYQSSSRDTLPAFAGIWSVVTGLFGILGGKSALRGLEITFLVLSIFAIGLSLYSSVVTAGKGYKVDIQKSREIAVKAYSKEQKQKCLTKPLPTRPTPTMISLATGEMQQMPQSLYFKCPNYGAAYTNLALMITCMFLALVAMSSTFFSCFAVCRCCGAGQRQEIYEQPPVAPSVYFTSPTQVTISQFESTAQSPIGPALPQIHLEKKRPSPTVTRSV